MIYMQPMRAKNSERSIFNSEDVLSRAATDMDMDSIMNAVMDIGVMIDMDW